MFYLHTQGIIHGDLKTLNILLDKHFTAKIADFGMAQVREKSGSIMQLTEGYTLSYAAPEVIGSLKIGKPSDVFSFGMIMWVIMTRKIPYMDKGLISAELKKEIRNGSFCVLLLADCHFSTNIRTAPHDAQ